MNDFEIIKNGFEELANSTIADQQSKYLKNKFLFYGIKSPDRKKIYGDMLKQAKKSKKIDWKLLDIAWNQPQREYQYFVTDYLDRMKQFLTFEDITKIEKFISTKQWWDSIDAFDVTVGSIGLRDQRVDNLMIQWSLSNDMWFRRLAIDHQLLRKELTNQELLATIIKNNLGSDEFFINKAIGWAFVITRK